MQNHANFICLETPFSFVTMDIYFNSIGYDFNDLVYFQRFSTFKSSKQFFAYEALYYIFSVYSINEAHKTYFAKRRRTIVRGITHVRIRYYFKFSRAAKHENYSTVPFCVIFNFRILKRESK